MVVQKAARKAAQSVGSRAVPMAVQMAEMMVARSAVSWAVRLVDWRVAY